MLIEGNKILKKDYIVRKATTPIYSLINTDEFSTTTLSIVNFEIWSISKLWDIESWEVSQSWKESLKSIHFHWLFKLNTDEELENFNIWAEHYSKVWKWILDFSRNNESLWKYIHYSPEGVDLIQDNDFKHLTINDCILYYQFEEEYYRLSVENLEITLNDTEILLIQNDFIIIKNDHKSNYVSKFINIKKQKLEAGGADQVIIDSLDKIWGDFPSYIEPNILVILNKDLDIELDMKRYLIKSLEGLNINVISSWNQLFFFDKPIPEKKLSIIQKYKWLNNQVTSNVFSHIEDLNENFRILWDNFHEITLNINQDICEYLIYELNDEKINEFKSIALSKFMPYKITFTFIGMSHQEYFLNNHKLVIDKRRKEKAEELIDLLFGCKTKRNLQEFKQKYPFNLFPFNCSQNILLIT